MNAPTWNEISKEQQTSFSFSGRIKLEDWYSNSTEGQECIPISRANIEKIITDAKNRVIDDAYGITNRWLYDCLESHPVRGKSVAIMGSIRPWYEAIALTHGGSPTTIEYNDPKYDHPDIKCISVPEYWKSPTLFDSAFSISSFEHDGLGRYGDPIDPWGDFRAMNEMKQMIKKDGLLYIAVPVGIDKVVWNAHRVYGEIRLPLLFSGWEIIKSEGFSEEELRLDYGNGGPHQPMFVLRNI